MSNKKTRERNKELRQKAEEMPRPYSEGYFQEMEDRDYWDIDVLEKHNAPIRINGIVLRGANKSMVVKTKHFLSRDT